GMPLIYSGMEYDLDHRLKFFEKDSIPKTKNKMWPLLEKLGQLKNENDALNGGKNPASYEPLESGNDKVLVFKRHKNDSDLIFIGNFSNTKQSLKSPVTGTFTNYMMSDKVDMKEENMELNPWEFKILT